MKNMLNDFYNYIIAKLSYLDEAETDVVREKIRSERHYFASIMSAEDFERFKDLEALHGEGHKIRYSNMFIRTFNLGVTLTAILTDSPLQPTTKGDTRAWKQ